VPFKVLDIIIIIYYISPPSPKQSLQAAVFFYGSSLIPPTPRAGRYYSPLVAVQSFASCGAGVLLLSVHSHHPQVYALQYRRKIGDAATLRLIAFLIARISPARTKGCSQTVRSRIDGRSIRTPSRCSLEPLLASEKPNGIWICQLPDALLA